VKPEEKEDKDRSASTMAKFNYRRTFSENVPKSQVSLGSGGIQNFFTIILNGLLGWGGGVLTTKMNQKCSDHLCNKNAWEVK